MRRAGASTPRDRALSSAPLIGDFLFESPNVNSEIRCTASVRKAPALALAQVQIMLASRVTPAHHMENIVTFVIPVRHQENARDWPQLKRHLSETVSSISRQTKPEWKAVIVANYGADLPELPPGFEVKRVDFPPNQLHERGKSDREDFYNALRLDKGRRVLAGMLHAGEMEYVMIVDGDDFVSCNLTSFVAANPHANGWYIRDGYVWSGGNLLYLYPKFSILCGSSHIVRADLYHLPARFEDADDAYIRRMLGSHIFIDDHLNAAGTPLAPLPFAGAVYRTGHDEAHSRSDTILKMFFWHKDVLRKPRRLPRRLFRLRVRTKRLRQEFFS